MKNLPLLALVALVVAACGGPGPAESPADALVVKADKDGPASAAALDPSDGPAAKESKPVAKGLPSSCDKMAGDACLPPKKFVKKLCLGDFPSVAGAMFSAGTPWTRAYLTHETAAWDASGGGSSNEKMMLDEEVLVLRFRDGNRPGGMQVSGASGTFDVLRWDGMCATLDKSELRFDVPSNPRSARILYKRFEPHIRDVLKKHEGIRPTFLSWRKHCKGVSVGNVSHECVKVDAEFSDTLAKNIREMSDFPAPKKVP